MPLTAVPQHGDVPPLDSREVGVVVVENLCHCAPFKVPVLQISVKVLAVAPAPTARTGSKPPVLASRYLKNAHWLAFRCVLDVAGGLG
jgi:hypothetical protein